MNTIFLPHYRNIIGGAFKVYFTSAARPQTHPPLLETNDNKEWCSKKEVQPPIKQEAVCSGCFSSTSNISNTLTLLLSNIIFLPHLCCMQSSRPEAPQQLPKFSFEYKSNLKLYLNTELGPSVCFNEEAGYKGLVYHRSWLLLWLSNWKIIINHKLGEGYFSCLPHRLRLVKVHKQEQRTWKIRACLLTLATLHLKESFCAYFALSTVTSVRLAKPQSGSNLRVATVTFQACLVAPSSGRSLARCGAGEGLAAALLENPPGPEAASREQICLFGKSWLE